MKWDLAFSADQATRQALDEDFVRNLDVRGVTTACEYLADQGIIGKASAPTRLTKKSNVEVQELAFFYIGDR